MPYDVGQTLKKCRINSKMTVKQISDILTQKGFKASESTIYSWENGNSQPTPGALLAMCEEYSITDVLSTFGYDGYNDDGSIQLSLKEIENVEKYRFISEYSPKGMETVDYILNREHELAKQIKEFNESSFESTTCTYPYLGKIACAGTGFYFDDIPTDTIEAPYVEGADFIIGVSGESMEPDYHDGEKLYVRKVEYLRNGDVGIFTIGNECFLKELGEDGLISRNKNYDDIPGDEKVRLIGKVIGKVEL